MYSFLKVRSIFLTLFFLSITAAAPLTLNDFSLVFGRDPTDGCASGLPPAFAVKRAEAAVRYKNEMALLVSEIHAYAKKANPSFAIIGNNSSGLFAVSDGYDRQEVAALSENMEAILLESFFFGWKMTNNAETPESERNEIRNQLAYAREVKKPILNIDYCNTAKKIILSETLNKKEKFISFAAVSNTLNRIPLYPVQLSGESDRDVDELEEIKNFLILLEPGVFRSRHDYLNALRETNFDLIIIDLFFGSEFLSRQEVDSLKTKKNGGRRLVFSYMSIGEAEEYRYYWQKSWSARPPSWIEKENPHWKGNFVVKYWEKEWKDILFGKPDAYLDLIIAQGFDGAFLDIVDGWVYFTEMEKQNKEGIK
ncbi:MAG: endo alpha-1,4 polygalactosaminidase [Acidaminococcales bacterium]|jgi:cysteinyl-tRNA synthetase|nr:endo alpha-1,4 polygalactosaminidase [Acidaminococcales bacterium]